MSEAELIAAVNERAASDARFRARLAHAVGTGSRPRLRTLMAEAVGSRLGALSPLARARAEDWFLGNPGFAPDRFAGGW